MRTHWLLTCLVLCLAAPAWAQDQKDEPKLTPGQEQYRTVLKDLTAARAVLVKQFGAAASAEESARIQKQMIGLAARYSTRFFKIAEEHPKDPGAEDALAFVCTLLAAHETVEELGAKAFGMLIADFPESKRIKSVVFAARSASTAALEKPLRQLMEGHADLEIQSQACLAWAENCRVRHEKALQKNDAGADGLYKQAAEAIRLGQAKYAETRSGREYEGALFALNNLTVGKTPPPIEGEDVVSAKSLKLSEYKGKVVVLCFWGNWCQPCRAMFPHERALVKRLEGKPFALLGVNSDSDREATKQTMAKEQLTWPSFWNGGKFGPIAKLYQVEFWPTTYVLDAQGVIRYRNVYGKEMAAAVDALLTEVALKR